jgi:hypothetical protein
MDLDLTGVRASSISSLNRKWGRTTESPRTGPYGRYSRVPLPSWVFEVEALSGPRSDIGGFGSQRDRSARRPASVDFGDPVVNDLKRHSPIFTASVRSPFINRRHGQRPACGSSFDCLAADAATPTFPATRRADRRKIERAFEFSLQQFQDNVGAE